MMNKSIEFMLQQVKEAKIRVEKYNVVYPNDMLKGNLNLLEMALQGYHCKLCAPMEGEKVEGMTQEKQKEIASKYAKLFHDSRFGDACNEFHCQFYANLVDYMMSLIKEVIDFGNETTPDKYLNKWLEVKTPEKKLLRLPTCSFINGQWVVPLEYNKIDRIYNCMLTTIFKEVPIGMVKLNREFFEIYCSEPR